MTGTRRRRRWSWRRPAWAGLWIAAVATAAAWRDTDFHAPPRFDGSGYAVLAESLAGGRGYREVDHPAAPRHAHFPPGYPAALAALNRAAGGRSAAAARGLSLACTVAATLAAWRWFAALYGPGVAGPLGLALAANWAWDRTGGAIQSEPLFLLLGQAALLLAAAVGAGRRRGLGAGLGLGALLAGAALTRHVGVALAAAVVVDLLVRRRRRREAVAAAVAAAALVSPWVAWLAWVRVDTQAGHLGGPGLPGRVVSQAAFYGRRIPDALTGPFVEAATVFQRRAAVAAAADLWAALATGLVLLGLALCLRSTRRRLAGLWAFATLALLLVWPFTEAGRFLIPLVPALLVGAVEGLGFGLRKGLRFRPGRARRAAAWLVLTASLPYSIYALASDRAGAQRRTHADFDAACRWIARPDSPARPGPVLTRHPGEVYWQTGRQALAASGPSPDSVARDVRTWRVAYLLIDGDRYAGAPEGPLPAFAAARPDAVRLVWSGGAVRVYEVTPPLTSAHFKDKLDVGPTPASPRPPVAH